jgi:hypothetical protein
MDRDRINSNFGCFFTGLGVLTFVIFGIVGLAGAAGNGGASWGPLLAFSGAVFALGGLLMVLIGLGMMGVRVPKAVRLLLLAAIVVVLILGITHQTKS